MINLKQDNRKKYGNIYHDENGVRYRKCKTCSDIKIEDINNFSIKNNAFMAHCRICKKKNKSEYRREKQKIITQKLKEKYSIGEYMCYDVNKKNAFVKDDIYYRKCSNKICDKILVESDNFYLMSKNRDGVIKQEYSIRCKDCMKTASIEYAKKHPDKIKKYYESIAGIEAKARGYEVAKEKYQTSEQYRLKKLESSKKSKQKNWKKDKAKRMTPEFRKKRQEYKRARKNADKCIKLRDNISNAINKAIRKGKSSKAGKSILDYLGYNILDLKSHIEKQFDNNMSWDNYGTYWHLDHIIPQSDLPYDSMERDNFKICWSLVNLRPLEAKQNLIDGVTRVRHKKKL